MLIYLQPAAQQKVLSLFHFALNAAACCFLGPSESAGALARDFETVDKHWRLYRKHSDVRMPVDARAPAAAPAEARVPAAAAARRRRAHSLSQLLGTYDALLDEFMPPSLLVNDRGELVHAFGGAEPLPRSCSDGRQGLDVLDIVDAELKMVLVGGLKRALAEASRRRLQGRAPPRQTASERLYKVTIAARARAGNGGTPHVLISFEARRRPAPQPAPARREIDLDQVSREQLGALEAELTHTQGEPAGRDRGARDQQRGAPGGRTRSCRPRTRSSRAPTRSSRASTRSSTRSTPSTSARSPS